MFLAEFSLADRKLTACARRPTVRCQGHNLLSTVFVCRVWSSNGWLSCYRTNPTFAGTLGFMDYSGSTMVHAVGGCAALVAVSVLGAREGRFGGHGKVFTLPGQVVRFYRVTVPDDRCMSGSCRLHALGRRRPLCLAIA